MITRVLRFLYSKFRILKFKILSTNTCIGSPILHTPLLSEGKGTISIAKNVHIGYPTSPSYFSSYVYLEARKSTSKIYIGDNVWFNNSCTIICDGSEIHIGSNCLFGTGLNIFDSDFHKTEINERNSGDHISKPVIIGNNVFTGFNVTILKGVSIGDNSVISAGSVVTSDIPENVIAGGIPAKILKKID